MIIQRVIAMSKIPKIESKSQRFQKKYGSKWHDNIEEYLKGMKMNMLHYTSGLTIEHL